MPLAPEFQDPPKGSNSPPYLITSFPALERTNWPVDSSAVFRITVGDPNPTDRLYIRWISDYPPVTVYTRVLWEQDQPNGVGGVDFSYTPNRCEAFSQNSTSHQLYIVVSDRPFLDPDDMALAALVLPYNLTEDAATIPVTGSWGIQCQ